MMLDHSLTPTDQPTTLPTVKYGETYRNALAIQRLVVTDATKEDCQAKVRCLLARAFVELETLKLRLRMKGPPKAVDVTKLPPKVRQQTDSASFSEA